MNIIVNDILDTLENESIFVIREAFGQMRSLSMLWSMGKDSTVLLHLVKKAFLGHVPINVIHIDTSYKIPEMITWRDDFAKRNHLPLIVSSNQEALAAGMGPDQGRLNCCGALKTQALLQVIEKHKIQGLLVGIRQDEEGSRSKERMASPRAGDSTWDYKEQPAEIWQYYNLHVPESVHMRIHPLLRWREIDIWRYIKRENLEVMPLYFARDGIRYRSLGCLPCTASISSTAATIDEIITELETIEVGERAGRAQDKVEHYAMQKLRAAGYM